MDKKKKLKSNDDLVILDLNHQLERQLGIVWHPERSQSKALQSLLNQLEPLQS